MSKLLSLLALLIATHAVAAGPLIHGLWVWKTPSVLAKPGSEDVLRDFCKSEGINEVYLSIPARDFAALKERLPAIIKKLRKADIRVEALLDSIDADLPGKPREKILTQTRDIVSFNAGHPAERFDGIHLDIEPHQRPENKGPGNLRCLPGLIETFRAVRKIAAADGMTTNADLPNKFLKGDAAQRRALLTSVDRVTLMLYELNSPDDGKTTAQKIGKLRKLSGHYLDLAYADLDSSDLARMVIGLRTPDYLELLPEMLHTLDQAHRENPRYLGWSWHCYNDRRASK